MWQSIKLYLFSKDPLVIKIIENSIKVVEIPLAVFENFDPSFINENESYNIFTFFDDSIANISGIPELPYPKVLLYKKNATPIKGFDHYIRKPFLPTEIVDYLKPQIPKEEASVLSSNSPEKLFGSDLLKSEDDEDLNLDAILQDKDIIQAPMEDPKEIDTLVDFSLSDDNNHLDIHNDLQKEPNSNTENLLDHFDTLQNTQNNFLHSYDTYDNQEVSNNDSNNIEDISTTEPNLNNIENITQSTNKDILNQEEKDIPSKIDQSEKVVEVDFDPALLEIPEPMYSDKILKNDHLALKVAELDKKSLSHHINLSDFDDLFDTKNKEQDLSTLEELQEIQNDREINALDAIDNAKSIKELTQELKENENANNIYQNNENKQSILNSSEIDEVKHLLETMHPGIYKDNSTQPETSHNKEIIDSEFDGIKEILQDDFLDFNLENTKALQSEESESNQPMPLDEHLAEFEQPFEKINSDIEELELEEEDIIEALNLPTSRLPQNHNDNILNCSGEEFIELINTTSKEQLKELLKNAKIHIQLAKHVKE